MRSSDIFLVSTLVTSTLAAPTGERNDLRDVRINETSLDAPWRADSIKDVFQHAWNGYYKYAFPNDELRPVDNTFSNSRNGWGASVVDAFTTAIIMGKGDIVNDCIDHILQIDWSVSYNDTEVSLFETTIRYMGGLLSGYDLLKGPLSDMYHDDRKLQGILDQAQHLANNLSFAFESPSGIPYNHLLLSNRSNDNSTTNGLASIGSLVLEWTHLSDLTGNETYGNLTQHAESYLLNPQPPSSEPWPGLVGTNVNISSGRFLDAAGGWTGGDDSFYEYLIKMYVYDPLRFAEYKDRWVLAVDSSIANLTSHPETRPDLTFLSMYIGKSPINLSGHLACFDGGNFILGGLVLKNQIYVDFGLSLVASCEDTYNNTLTGIGPETFMWNIDNTSDSSAAQKLFHEKAGFVIVDSGYYLRPEVIESFYYAYRATGDSKYQDWAWHAFRAIVKFTQVGSGYSEIKDVNATRGGGFENFQDSYFLAEVLKYSYLIHTADAPWQVNHNGVNEFVFNTEAHPFKVAGTPI